MKEIIYPMPKVTSSTIKLKANKIPPKSYAFQLHIIQDTLHYNNNTVFRYTDLPLAAKRKGMFFISTSAKVLVHVLTGKNKNEYYWSTLCRHRGYLYYPVSIDDDWSKVLVEIRPKVKAKRSCNTPRSSISYFLKRLYKVFPHIKVQESKLAMGVVWDIYIPKYRIGIVLSNKKIEHANIITVSSKPYCEKSTDRAIKKIQNNIDTLETIWYNQK